MNYQDWITDLKANNNDLADFITKLEPFISDVGLNVPKFEKAIESGLQKIENDLLDSFKQKQNAKT